MKRILLYINGVLAIRSEPIDEETRTFRIECWKRVYGDRARIEIQ